MSTDYDDTKIETECTPLLLGYFSKDLIGEFENTFISFAKTTTWCWQQGCMLQWNPAEPNSQVFFNTLIDGSYGSVLFDIRHKKTLKQYPYPIYAVDPRGRKAITLNFSRLGRLRPGYGYPLLADNTIGDRAPSDDGLFIFDLGNGRKKLLISLESLAQTSRAVGGEHYINHATFSPNGQRIVFFHLWAKEGTEERGLRVCEINPETGIWGEIESDRITSHYCWRDEDAYLSTTLDETGKCHYTLYDLASRTRTDLNLPLSSDGHPMFHPQDNNLFVTDSYPDRRRDQCLYIVNITTKKVIEVGALFTPFKYREQVRCDLHPRWDRNGDFVIVDTTVKKKRKLGVLNVHEEVQRNGLFPGREVSF